MNKICYRIYTEDKNYGKTVDTIHEYFQGATVYRELTGLWHGVEEESLVIEIIETEEKESLVRALANSLKLVNQQQVIFMSKQPITLEIIT